MRYRGYAGCQPQKSEMNTLWRQAFSHRNKVYSTHKSIKMKPTCDYFRSRFYNAMKCSWATQLSPKCSYQIFSSTVQNQELNRPLSFMKPSSSMYSAIVTENKLRYAFYKLISKSFHLWKMGGYLLSFPSSFPRVQSPCPEFLFPVTPGNFKEFSQAVLA